MESNAGELKQTSDHLSKISGFVRQVTSMTGVKRSSVQKELSGHLYHLYTGLVIKTGKLS